MCIVRRYKTLETTLKCVIKLPDIFNKYERRLSIKLDTGADLTILPASLLGVYSEDEFINKVRNSENLFIVDDNKTKLHNKIITADIMGINSLAETTKFYALQVDSFKFYNHDSDKNELKIKRSEKYDNYYASAGGVTYQYLSNSGYYNHNKIMYANLDK